LALKKGGEVLIKKAILLIVTILGSILLGVAIGQVLVQYWHPNIGTLDTTLEMYLGGTQYGNTTAINWGLCEPGLTHSIENMTVRNVGNTPLTVYIVTEGIPVDWILEWQVNNMEIQPDQQIEGWLNLTIPIDATEWGTWGFYIRGE